MKNIIKRIFIGVSIGLIIGFINSCEVHAETINVNLPVPQTYGAYQDCGTSSCITINQSPQTSSLYNNAYTSQWIGSTNPTSGYVIYNLGSPGYCENRNLTINGSVSFRNPLSPTGERAVFTLTRAFMNNLNNLVDCTITGNNYSCTSIGGGVLYLSFEYTGAYRTDVLLNRTVSVTCNATTNDIIQNQNQNTNSIINNQNQNTNSIINNQNQNTTIINNSINETNDFLKDNSLPTNTSNDINDLNNEINTNGTITNLITLPITFLQKIINTMENSCTPVVIGELYDYNFTFPCINPSDYIGIIWNIIDVICCGFLVYKFSMHLVKIFHRVTSLKDGGLEEAYD